MTAFSVADVLDRAADVLDERGHTKGNLVDSSGRVCAFGAISVAAGGGGTLRAGELSTAFVAAANALGDYLNLEPGRCSFVNLVDPAGTELKHPYSVPDWNNAHERTPGEVTAALRAAAAIERAREGASRLSLGDLRRECKREDGVNNTLLAVRAARTVRRAVVDTTEPSVV